MKQIGQEHKCQYSHGRITVIGTHDGPIWHLQCHFDESESEPIMFCPWCGVELDLVSVRGGC